MRLLFLGTYGPGRSPSQRYRFDDPNMDLFFLGALGWGPAGGLLVGEAFHIANQIVDGDSVSWAQAFEKQGGILSKQADIWQERGWIRAAGEERLKAFVCYRMAWQFVSPGDYFLSLFHASQALFDQAVQELGFAVESFTVPYKGGELPGHFFKASDPSAPTVLVIGGADTCHEDRFLSQGRHFIERGYSVALVDLPGQGIVQEQGLYWEKNVEGSIGAVIDTLIDRFGVNTNKLAMLGMSLGGYFGCRAAAEDPFEHRDTRDQWQATPTAVGLFLLQAAQDDHLPVLHPNDGFECSFHTAWRCGIADPLGEVTLSDLDLQCDHVVTADDGHDLH